jgi:hypothetical protein
MLKRQIAYAKLGILLMAAGVGLALSAVIEGVFIRIIGQGVAFAQSIVAAMFLSVGYWIVRRSHYWSIR